LIFFNQEIFESESNQDHQANKFNRVDLLVKDTSGQLFIIEIQNDSEADYLQRLVFPLKQTLRDAVMAALERMLDD